MQKFVPLGGRNHHRLEKTFAEADAQSIQGEGR
jgi:hypothetical protein